MLCKKCGAQVGASRFCTSCGAPLEEEIVETVAPEVETAEICTPEVTQIPGKGMATASLVLGLVGLILSVICCIPACYEFVSIPLAILCGLAGLILGIVAKGKAKDAGCKNRKATLGRLFSVFTLVIVVLYWIFGAILTSLTLPLVEEAFYSLF